MVHAEPRPQPDGTVVPAGRAKQEIDYGRRGKGYIFGAFRPATGEAAHRPLPEPDAANWADFLEKAEAWVPAEVERVYAIVDNLSAHRATDVLLFCLAHPRWEFVFQPKYAAYLNLIEPWWKVLKSLALKGRRFETWEEVCRAVEEATAYWNGHRHPFVWGRRRRRRAACRMNHSAIVDSGSSTFRRTFGSRNRRRAAPGTRPDRPPLHTATPAPPAADAAPTGRRGPRRRTALPPPGGSAG